jgi:hypothetical protein
MHSLVLMLAISGTGDDGCSTPCAPKVTCCKSSCDPCGRHRLISLRSSCCPKPACDPCPKVSSCDPCGRPSLLARLRARRCCTSTCNGHSHANGETPVAEQMPKQRPPTTEETPKPSTKAVN